ncbi:MAG: fibronectin type III-like domain-contianing protein, partial [Candidatus Promineifilaceae bacterium]
VQLYVRDEVASVTRPLKELKGFQRVPLEPGERRTVTFTLAANQLAFYDSQMRYVLEPGTIKLMVGTSSADLPLGAEIEVVGETAVLPQKTFFTQVTIS